MLQKESKCMKEKENEITDTELEKFVQRLTKQREMYKEQGRKYREKQKRMKQLCIERGLIEK